MNRLPQLLAVVGLGLATVAGYFAAEAIGQDPAGARTVTVDVGTGMQGLPGEPGPPGETGPRGPAGPAGLECPIGYSAGVLVINAPGGQTRIWTCLGA